MNPRPKPTKITAKIYAPVFEAFRSQLEALPIKRDAFIDLMIERELPRVAADLAGKVNSSEAKRYIAHSLKRMGGSKVGPLRPLSVSVRKTTSDALRKLEQLHNFPRDAFINRLIVLLRSSDELLKALELPMHVSKVGGGVEDMRTSPLKAFEATFYDPLYYLHTACRKRHGCGLYLLDMPRELVAFSCYIPDKDVPGTEEHETAQAEWAEALGLLESNLTPIARRGRKRGAKSRERG